MRNLLWETRDKKYEYILLASAAVLIVLLVLVEVYVQSRTNNLNAQRTAEILLTDVSTALEQNERDRAVMIDVQKQSCINQAQSVVYMLEHNPQAREDLAELQKLAELAGVDEIHIFNPEGRIIAGTIPAYFGISMRSGDQIRFFLPMLGNKQLSMCQKIVANTAEARPMMYAAVWNTAGTEIVQIGMQPRRLMELLRQNELSHVVEMMPVPDDLCIFVAGQWRGEVYGATLKEYVGAKLDKLGLPDDDLQVNEFRHSEITLNGKQYLCSRQMSGPYVLGVLQEVSHIHKGLLTSVSVVLVYLLLALAGIFFVVKKLRQRIWQEAEAREKQQEVLIRMSEVYFGIHTVDLDTDRAEELYAKPLVSEQLQLDKPIAAQLAGVMTKMINPAHLERMLRFVDFSTLPERMRECNYIYEDFLGVHIWIRASFVVIERRADGTPRVVVFRTLDINDDKQRELKLVLSSTTDGLTGCLNRYACGRDLAEYEKAPLPENFVFVSLDVNGLKVVNDNLGHAAGDELLCGAAGVITAAFAPYGKVYRMGGDEFTAIIEADAGQLATLKQEFIRLQRAWHGTTVPELNISAGYAPYAEMPGCTLHELSKRADVNMYADKSAFYRNRGFDRRGQKAADSALSGMYTKILQINLTTDTYQISQMPEEEKNNLYGFTDKISTWLHAFGISGLVHPDDLENYLQQTGLENLRTYFRNGGQHLVIKYRRRQGTTFHPVMMELIPGTGYSHEDQLVYLYVKNIE